VHLSGRVPVHPAGVRTQACDARERCTSRFASTPRLFDAAIGIGFTGTQDAYLASDAQSGSGCLCARSVYGRMFRNWGIDELGRRRWQLG
jgi:hypothetical protein